MASRFLKEGLSAGRVISGRWEMTRRHDLIYRKDGPEEQIVVQGPLLQAKPGQVTFRVDRQAVGGDLTGRRLTLRGRWQADPKNRLSFVVDRRSRPSDWLVLQGAWELNRRNEILYRWRGEQLKTKKKTERLIRFQGVWELSDDRHLTYVLDRELGSSFRFRGTYQTPTLAAKTGAIRFQIGAEVKGRRRVETITLFGKWKLSRGLALALEMPAGPGHRRRQITFGADFEIGRAGQVTARLKTGSGEPLGIEVALTRSLLAGSGEAFLRLNRSLEAQAVEAGVRLRW
ncbi:MAG: hypothetical protein COV76_07055 [Candidatus Omnitrophica bacterium CG11_big_fil_rev_8_21_14_0_20_64_10]|nr:MAG: hypothetical protein COV76_07055 [Candidatus Omnitrophica bacterium CG11_big_fil_rev_8_21_14_0_20_64_10]